MLIREVWNAGTIEPLLQLDLRVVDDDEIRLQPEDSLDTRIEQSTHLRETGDLRRIFIVVADAHDSSAAANREDHFSNGWNQ